ncbi:MAG TPA: hypothetical protein VFH53_09210 [Phycisphaerae bacterium]|nr:hypothetical protein [Phycisphaerae bacterium]
MIVSKARKFCFVSTPKCGTNSLYAVLQAAFVGVRQPPGFHRNTIPAGARGLFRWTVVRNPFARAVSIWWSTVKNPKNRRVARAELLKAKGRDDLEAFMEWILEGPAESLARRCLRQNMTDWLRPAEPFQAVLHLERLEQEVLELPFWKPVPLPHLNRSDGRPPWRTFITSRARDLVLAWAGEDFERFGYETAP